MSTSPPSPAAVARLVESQAGAWWRAGDFDAIDAACAAVPVEALAQWPAVARWRGLAAAMREGGEALTCLEAAHAGFLRVGAEEEALRTAHAALLLCLLDIGAMDRVNDWLARADGALPPPSDLWLDLGTLARGVLGDAQPPQADAAVARLHAQLRPLRTELSADERLIAAQMLVNHHFARQQYAQFDFLATLVEDPSHFGAASPLTRGRWHYTLGFAHYQIGRHRQAEECWQQAVALCETHALHGLQLQTTLALVRLLLDRGRVDEADMLLRPVQPAWGAGRVMQLVTVQQMRARLLLMQRQAVRALATLDEALALAEASAVSAEEQASCLTDRAQMLVALGRAAEAEALLLHLANTHGGRNAEVYRCLHGLLCAVRLADTAPADARVALTQALRSAQQIRYTMFFRLLPAFAGRLCALALQAQVETVFVVEVIRERTLPAPPDAGDRWPWPLLLRLFGGFEMRRAGVRQASAGKTAHKPLELLRALACERTLALGMAVAGEMLWPEADGASARKNLEMTVQRLRRLLGDDTLVLVGDGRVALDASRCSSDVLQRRGAIERLEALALQATAPAGDPSEHAIETEARSLVAVVMQLSVGELVPEAPEVPWLLAQRTLCQRETVRAALAAATLMERAGADAAERALLQAALRIEPHAETLVRRLMRAYERDGQRADAARIYEQLRTDLQAQGLAPSAQTEALWRGLFGGGAAPTWPR